MAYLHIGNLYKEQDILLFRECYALEKIHGTSAHLGFKKVYEVYLDTAPEKKEYKIEIRYFSGGEKHDKFVALFNDKELKEKFDKLGIDEAIVYGEAYGGKCQGMKEVYGDKLKFVAFEVKIHDSYLSVPQAEEIVLSLGLDFVDYKKIPATLEAIDKERDRPSTQAIKNGITSISPGEYSPSKVAEFGFINKQVINNPKKREGIVLRPLMELRKNNGERIIAKHKNEDYKETKSKRTVSDPEKLKVIEEANAVAEEWVTPMRLNHILDKIKEPSMEKMREIITSMIEDVQREGEKEIAWSKAVQKAIGKKTAQMVKEFFKERLIKIHKKELK